MARAQHAERLLQDDVLQEAFSMVERHYINTIINGNSSMDDVLDARQSILALKKVQTQLQTYVVDGKVEERNKK